MAEFIKVDALGDACPLPVVKAKPSAIGFSQLGAESDCILKLARLVKVQCQLA